MGRKIRRLQVVVENSNETFTSACKAPCFPKCWSVSGCVSLRLKSPNRESFWNARGTIRMVNLKGDHKCIRWRLTTPYQRTKWKKKERKEEKAVNACVLTDGPSRGPRHLSEILAPLGSGGPLLATQWPLALAPIPLWGRCSWWQIWPEDFFHYPPTSPFTSNLKARPWLSLSSREDKDVGPSGLTPRAQLSITASPPLPPFTPGSWTHGCQPGNNPQTIEAWKPGLDTLLATYLLLLAAVEA